MRETRSLRLSAPGIPRATRSPRSRPTRAPRCWREASRLVPLLSMRLAAPSTLVDINGMPDLDGIDVTDEGVRIGALARHADVLADEEVRRVQPLVSLALANVAHATIRNRGTTVGSLVHADAAAEMPVVLTLLGGSVDVTGPSGSRTIPADELYVGPLETSLAHDEIATSAFFPALAPGRAGGVRRDRPAARRLRPGRRRRAGRRRQRPGRLRLGQRPAHGGRPERGTRRRRRATSRSSSWSPPTTSTPPRPTGPSWCGCSPAESSRRPHDRGAARRTPRGQRRRPTRSPCPRAGCSPTRSATTSA